MSRWPHTAVQDDNHNGKFFFFIFFQTQYFFFFHLTKHKVKVDRRDEKLPCCGKVYLLP